MMMMTVTDIETALNSGERAVELDGKDYKLDRAIRLPSHSTLVGKSASSSRLVNTTATQPWGDSATVQVLQGHDYGIGYVDAFTRLADPNTVALQSGAENYSPGTVCWSWPWTDTGVRRGKPTRHVVVARQGEIVTLDPAPRRSANALCWTRGLIAAGAKERSSTVRTTTPPPADWLGKIVLVSDGQQIANEPRGELRRVIEVLPNGVRLDRPLRLNNYIQAALVVAPINAVEDITVRDLTIDAGPIGWAFYGKFIYGLRFERCRFLGVTEINECAHVDFVDCEGGHLKVNCTHDLGVYGGQWQRVSFEEGCLDVTIAGVDFPLRAGQPGIACDPEQKCERITVRDCVFGGRNSLSPIALEGRECRIERCKIRCGPSDAHVYISGNRAAMLDVQSDRGLVFQWGRDQVAQRLTAPGIALGWNNGESRGVAFDLRTPALDNKGGWVVHPGGGIDGIIGRWPGDESDGLVRDALDKLS